MAINPNLTTPQNDSSRTLWVALAVLALGIIGYATYTSYERTDYNATASQNMVEDTSQPQEATPQAPANENRVQ